MDIVFGPVLPWLLVIFGSWLAYQHLRQNGRILLRLEAIEESLERRGGGAAPQTPGLPPGTQAPDFDLPDLAGTRHKLSEYRGKELLLVFFNPQCGFCTKIAAQLAALTFDGSNGSALPLVITTGDAEENRMLIKEHGLRCPVLIQKEMEVASQYRASGTPMGCRIDVQGTIVSPLAVGGEPVLQLAGGDWMQPLQTGKPHGKPRDPSLARSRLNRDGLRAGAVAPDFQLPRVDKGELALADLRGRRVLLVFSDPECGPCDVLAPQLQELHAERRDLTVIVISRRDAVATRSKATSLGLTYPIVMQEKWEVSLKYGMFATPIGYLIDEQGVLLSDVAVGIDPILALAHERAPTPRNHAANGRVAAV